MAKKRLQLQWLILPVAGLLVWAGVRAYRNQPGAEIGKDYATAAMERMAMRDYEGAIPVIQQAVDAPMPVSKEVAMLESVNLATVAKALETRSDLALAEQVRQRIVLVLESTVGREDPSLIASLDALAVLLSAEGKSTEAEIALRRSISIAEKQIRDDPAMADREAFVALQYSRLAELLAKQGRLDDAEATHRRAVSTIYRYHARTGKNAGEAAIEAAYVKILILRGRSSSEVTAEIARQKQEAGLKEE
ncbi:hypothetical protein [Haloferula sp. BvORR071]|uniref:hypothetical protein n=1 Tax=Haloferula sp. BvORR071 TaxID=1396141 RepID=UPI00069861A4|nr:hypothetical protein [Haloferula sp. BvORR071]